MSDPEITKEEFCARFKAHMLKLAGDAIDYGFADGTSVAEYADAIAPLYWENKYQRSDGPELCADIDMDCWEDE